MSGTISLDRCKIGFIGCGNMALAMIGPLLMKKIIHPSRLFISTKTTETGADLAQRYGVHACVHNSDVVHNCHIIFLATKPQSLNTVMSELYLGADFESKLFVSIAAGVTIEKLEKMMIDGNKLTYPSTVKIIRTMPNQPLSVGHGITLYCRNSFVTDKDAALVVQLLSNIGIVEEIDESLMDVAGALTGCGPAFAYLIMEALADGAVKNGLSRALAKKFAAQVFVGAGKMVATTDKNLAQLKDEVCSPGGTTIAGIYQLEIGSVRASLMNAVEAATKRSKEL